MAELRFGEDDAGDEGAEGEGHAGEVGGVADADADGDDGDEEEFGGAPGVDELEKAGEEAGAGEVDDGEDDGGEGEGFGEGREDGFRGAAELGENDEHGDDGEILDDEEADHDAAGEGGGEAGGGEGFEHDHGAGDGDHGAEPDGFRGWDGEEVFGRQGAGGDGEGDLQRAAEEGDTANGLEILEGDLQPEREQQQSHADFGEGFDVVDLYDRGAGGEGPDDDAGGDIADQEGQAKCVGENRAEQAGDDDEYKILCDAQGGNSSRLLLSLYWRRRMAKTPARPARPSIQVEGSGTPVGGGSMGAKPTVTRMLFSVSEPMPVAVLMLPSMMKLRLPGR